MEATSKPFTPNGTKMDIAKELENHIISEMTNLFEKNPLCRDFHEGDWFDKDYYKKHILECVLRIRLNNQLDALAVKKATETDLTLAKSLAYYLYDEIGHEDLFYSDLVGMGMSKKEIEDSSVLSSTVALIGYLKESVEQQGAGPAVLWDYFLEVYSDRFNRKITEKAEKHLERESTKGAMSHIITDETEDHVGLMSGMLARVVKNDLDLQNAKNHISICINFVGQYFKELELVSLNSQKSVGNL